VPTGLVSVSRGAVGYDSAVQLLDLPAGRHGNAAFKLKPHKQSVEDLKTQIRQTRTVAIYGIHFDTASAKLRPDSLPSLNRIAVVRYARRRRAVTLMKFTSATHSTIPNPIRRSGSFTSRV
jgi:hypothetical protein